MTKYKTIINYFSDNKNKKSVSHRFRNKRFEFFLSEIKKLQKPLSILDIGGTTEFWESMQFKETDISITLFNLGNPPSVAPPFHAIQGDATNMLEIQDQQYDLVFSNSVIEHLFTWENQQKMAKEVHRVGKWHFIQSPNYWFPIEPHWVFPAFQYFPFKLKKWLTQNFNLGHIPKQKNSTDAINQVNEIRLLSKREMCTLFPQSKVYTEKIIGLNKSFIAYKIDYQSD